MKAKLMGYSPVSFTTKDGKLIEGMTFSIAHPDEHTTGMRVERFFIKSNIEIPQIKVGDEITLVFSQHGKVEAITKD